MLQATPPPPRATFAARFHTQAVLASCPPQIMHAFSVAPFDQNLSIEGMTLTEDSATLGSLGVTPESVVLLKVMW